MSKTPRVIERRKVAGAFVAIRELHRVAFKIDKMELRRATTAVAMLVENLDHAPGELRDEHRTALVRARLEIARGGLGYETLQQLIRLFPEFTPIIPGETSGTAIGELDDELEDRVFFRR